MATRPQEALAAACQAVPGLDRRRRRVRLSASPARRRETAEELLRLAGVAADRIERGIAVLREDPDALDAFRAANRAVREGSAPQAGDREHPSGDRSSLRSSSSTCRASPIADDPHRETVDLLYFPTGGGKTEAYWVFQRSRSCCGDCGNPSDGGRGRWSVRGHAVHAAAADDRPARTRRGPRLRPRA